MGPRLLRASFSLGSARQRFASARQSGACVHGQGRAAGRSGGMATGGVVCEAAAANPLLTTGLPLWSQIKAEHVEPAIGSLLDTLESDVSALEKTLAGESYSWSVVTELERKTDPLGRAWGTVSHLKGVKDSEELRAAHEKMQPRVVEVTQKIASSASLYANFKAVRDGRAVGGARSSSSPSDLLSWESLSEAEQRLIDSAVKDAELSGVGLEGDAKKRFVDIQSRLSKLSTTFSNNILDSTKAFKELVRSKEDVDGLPGTALELAAETAKKNGEEGATADAGPWMFTLDGPSYLGVMQHAKNRDLREKVYKAYLTRSSSGDGDNTPIINETLALRQERAELLGFPNHAEVSLARKMATLDRAKELLEDLRSQSWDSAVQDLEDVKKHAAEGGFEGELRQWDVPFWAERLREARFDIKDEELRPYFQLPSVIEGMFELASRLFDVVIKEKETTEKWHKDVQFFEISAADTGAPIAYFYLDPFSRPEEKRGGAWMDEVVVRSRALAPEGADVRLPVAHMVCNGTPPTETKPSLMTHREVETLFHEFGHALQHMLTTQDMSAVSGINGVEWDAVELPSQFMENWCYHRKTVMGFAKHYQTGEPLPEELFKKLVAARTYRAGTMMLRQVHFALTDLELHTNFDASKETVFDVDRRIAQKTMVMPPYEGDRFLCGFGHIFAGTKPAVLAELSAVLFP